MRGLTRLLSGILTLLFMVMIAFAGVLAWFSEAVDAPGPLAERRNVIIPVGDSTRMIAERLEQHGAISGQTIFLAQVMSQNVVARMSGQPERHMKAGEYEIEPKSSVRQIIKTLTEGRAVLHSVTVPEGLTSHHIVKRLLNDASLSGNITQVPPEGGLLPETFRVPRNTPRAQILEMLREEQAKFLNAAWEARDPDLPLRDVAEALVLASIVEKESGPRDDPKRVAAVFINRLKRNIRLQSDPTILYGKHGPKVEWGSKIFRSDIGKKTAYNTYQIDGLPPTPICNPGRRAIEAVLHPAQTNELYFVADGRGGHIFSETLEQHERAVANWRKIEREIRANEAERAKQATDQGAVQTPAVATVTTRPSGAAGGPAPRLINNPHASRLALSPGQAGDEQLVPLPVRRPQR